MQAFGTTLPGLVVLEPTVFGDERGFFYESYNARRFAELLGVADDAAPYFVQDNHSRSTQGVLRGLHYQIQQAQGKLVRVTAGTVFDVAVDLRKSSPTFGKWCGVHLSAENRRQLWIPSGFAHGFLVTSTHAEFLYKTTDYWAPEYERCIAWDDATIGIDWPLHGVTPQLSVKDQQGQALAIAEVFA